MRKDMTNKKLPKSVRIFLRREKARLRREIPNETDAEIKISELVLKIRGSQGAV
ncbi:MAG: hypothetical protein Q7R91_01805 [bacterium]|nr:hypothetical protein [bacterium]